MLGIGWYCWKRTLFISYMLFRGLVVRKDVEPINEKGENIKITGNENCDPAVTM